MKEVHVTPEGTLLVDSDAKGNLRRQIWKPDEITVEVHHPNYTLTDLNDWLRDRNKQAVTEVVPIQVMVQAYQAMVLANEETPE